MVAILHPQKICQVLDSGVIYMASQYSPSRSADPEIIIRPLGAKSISVTHPQVNRLCTAFAVGFLLALVQSPNEALEILCIVLTCAVYPKDHVRAFIRKES